MARLVSFRKLPFRARGIMTAAALAGMLLGPAGRASDAWVQERLPPVPAWTEWQQRTGEEPPDVQQLPRRNALPEPLRFDDGRRVTSAADWEERRQEIWRHFERYVTGTFPPQPTLTEAVREREQPGDGYLMRHYLLRFASDGREGAVRVQVTQPKGPGPFPVLITPGFGGWAPRLIRRGYVSVGYAGSDRADDGEPLAALYPEHDFAALPRRAWLAHVVLDFIATLPEVNQQQVALFGYSRDGKMAAYASARDPRIAALIAGSTGVGGFLPWRLAGERGSGEGIESTTRMFPSWFVPRLRFFAGREDRLPVDGNLLLALNAPRPVLLEYGLNDEVSNIWAIERSFESARAVYELLGAPEQPSLLRSPGFHGGIDAEACLDWLDGVFGRSPRPWVNDRMYAWDLEAWRARVGETAPPAALTRRLADASMTPEDRRVAVADAVTWMLGEAPPRIPTTGRAAAPSPFPMRPPPPGPVEVARGAPANPGQLAPDVPAWVISRGGQEFGWLEPQKDRVQSRRIRFGSNVEGHLYYPLNTPEGARLPTVIWLHGYSFPLGYMWVYRRDLHPILALVEAGFAVFAYDQVGFGSRALEARTFYERHPRWSLLGRMVEDVTTAVDALVEDPVVAADRIALLGYTLGGTVALHAAALDERIHRVATVSGFTPLRTDARQQGLTGLERYYQEFPLLPRVASFADRPASVPYDYDDLLALHSPRSVLVVQPRHDRDADVDEVRAAVERARRHFPPPAQVRLELFEPDDYARLTTSTQQAIIQWLQTPP